VVAVKLTDEVSPIEPEVSRLPLGTFLEENKNVLLNIPILGNSIIVRKFS
jgi:hypothetical protein